LSYEIADRIVAAAGPLQGYDILEIGGGFGILTCRIAELAQRVYVVEIDANLVRALEDILSGYKNVEIIHGDALEIDLPGIDKIISNLPYHISSDITFRLLKETGFQVAVLMFQKEFAERLIAEPGTSNYSRLTVNAKYLAHIEEVLQVSAKSFYPVPAVDSMVLRFTPRTSGPVARNNQVLFWMIQGIYSYPKKQLRNALRIWLQSLDENKRLEKEILKRSEIDGTLRLRNLSLPTIVKLADTVLDLVKTGIISGPRNDRR
jgi:16S rRNA (adenine1518-N6/adenine1519-N6)-dimethyltransferase